MSCGFFCAIIKPFHKRYTFSRKVEKGVAATLFISTVIWLKLPRLRMVEIRAAFEVSAAKKCRISGISGHSKNLMTDRLFYQSRGSYLAQKEGFEPSNSF